MVEGRATRARLGNAWAAAQPAARDESAAPPTALFFCKKRPPKADGSPARLRPGRPTAVFRGGGDTFFFFSLSHWWRLTEGSEAVDPSYWRRDSEAVGRPGLRKRAENRVGLVGGKSPSKAAARLGPRQNIFLFFFSGPGQRASSSPPGRSAIGSPAAIYRRRFLQGVFFFCLVPWQREGLSRYRCGGREEETRKKIHRL